MRKAGLGSPIVSPHAAATSGCGAWLNRARKFLCQYRPGLHQFAGAAVWRRLPTQVGNKIEIGLGQYPVRERVATKQPVTDRVVRRCTPQRREGPQSTLDRFLDRSECFHCEVRGGKQRCHLCLALRFGGELHRTRASRVLVCACGRLQSLKRLADADDAVARQTLDHVPGGDVVPSTTDCTVALGPASSWDSGRPARRTC